VDGSPGSQVARSQSFLSLPGQCVYPFEFLVRVDSTVFHAPYGGVVLDNVPSSLRSSFRAMPLDALLCSLLQRRPFARLWRASRRRPLRSFPSAIWANSLLGLPDSSR